MHQFELKNIIIIICIIYVMNFTKNKLCTHNNIAIAFQYFSSSYQIQLFQTPAVETVDPDVLIINP